MDRQETWKAALGSRIPANALSQLLLRLMARGDIAAVTVQEIAAAAYVDGWGNDKDFATRLSRVGASGKYKGNVLRDIMSLAEQLGVCASSAKPYYIEIPDGHTLPIFLPHEIMAQFVKTLGGLEQLTLSPQDLGAEEGLGKLVRDWCSAPDVNLDSGPDSVIACGMHCDGVAYSSSIRAGATKSVNVCSINCISAKSDKLKHNRCPCFLQAAALDHFRATKGATQTSTLL